MIRMVRLVLSIVVVLCLLPLKNISAQKSSVYTSSQALSLFNDGNYVEAEKAYDYLHRKYTREVKYNFYLGICMMKNRSDLSQAIKLLNYSRIKGMGKNTYFYLGRAHQLSYQYDEALKNFKLFLKYASRSDEKVETTQRYIEECNNGKAISMKIYNIEVLQKETTSKDDLLNQYHPLKDVGHLYKNQDFFESGVNPNHILFETERGDVVYFTMADSEEDTLSIYKMEKLLDGWSESKRLNAPVNSVYNDAYPFLETDGVTFYFASNRPGGFGGYDIYKVYYDSESQSYLDPVNLGVPFNSPDDDFLFVSDEFSGEAWFASNREIGGDELVVYTIKWDGNQVRSMAENENQIAAMASLRVSGEEDENEEVDDNGLEKYSMTKAKRKFDDLFNFSVNDTIVYTRFEQFKDPEAKKLFKKAYFLEQEKDSLSSELQSRRGDFAKENNAEKQNALVKEILDLESKVYSLEDRINDGYLYARQKELNLILNQIEEGTYAPESGSGQGGSNKVELGGILIPEKYSLYTSDEFERYSTMHKEMYVTLFSENDRKILHSADSMYVWANILNLQSAHLLANSNKPEEQSAVKLSDLLKRNSDEEEEDASSENMIQESKELKVLSIRLYHKALDTKYPIYWLKLKDISSKYEDGKGEDIKDLIYQGDAYFREAKNSMNVAGGLSIEGYEKAGTMKRAGVESQENALQLYCEKNDGVEDFKQESVRKGTVQKSYSELQGGGDEERMESKKAASKQHEIEEKENVIPEIAKEETVLKEEPKETLKEEYRVQIGVFRNMPDRNALSKIPEVTSLELEGRGLTKYFSGRYKTKQEAISAIPQIVAAGFPGAYVVFFKNGKLAQMKE